MSAQRSRDEELFAQPLDGAECCAWCALRVTRGLHAAFAPLIAFSRSIADLLIYQPESLRPMPNVIRRHARWNMTPARLSATPPGPCPQPP